jgi:hypothetical protein
MKWLWMKILFRIDPNSLSHPEIHPFPSVNFDMEGSQFGKISG